MRRWSGVCFAALLLACSSSSSQPAPILNDAPLPVLERSGTRLQARGFESEGLFVFDSFFDTQLGLACARGPASDGSDRCVPLANPCGDANAVAAEPSTLVAFTSTSEVPLAEGFAAVVANGEDGSRVGTGELVDQGKRCAITAGTCGAPAASTCTSTLGDGSTTHGALEEKTKITSDGTPVRRSAIVDPSLGGGGACHFERTTDGATRCVPTDVATMEANTFADPGCTRAVFKLPACDAKYVRFEDPQCGSPPRFFLIEPLGTQMYTQSADGSCALTDARAGLVTYRDELRPENLAQGQPVTR